MNDNSKVLRGFGIFPSELVYDETEISIQRQLYSIVTNIVLVIFCSTSILSNIMSSMTNESFGWIFYIQLILMLSILVSLFVLIYLLFNYRKKNKKVFRYEEIKHFETIEINTYINLKFEFTDNSEDVIKLYRNKKSFDFINFLKTKTEFSRT